MHIIESYVCRKMVSIPVWIDVVNIIMDCCPRDYNLKFYHAAYEFRLYYWSLSREEQSQELIRGWKHTYDEYTDKMHLLVGQRNICVQCYRQILGVSRQRWGKLFKAWQESEYKIVRLESKHQIRRR